MTYRANIHDYERLLASLSHQARRRAVAKGVFIDFEDLIQESRIAFAQACEKFDETRGAKFSTYLWSAVRNNLSSYESKVVDLHMTTTSMDRMIGEDAGTLHDILPADIETVEDKMVRLEDENEGFARLSDDAKRVTAILSDPPRELMLELARMEAFRLNCKANGYAAASRVLDVQMICTALGFDKSRTRRVKHEFKRIMEEAYG